MSVHTKNQDLEKEKAKGVAQRLQGTEPPPMPKDHQLISFGDRLTYTFAYGTEVGSIHYDRGRSEIFFKGHNIRNMEVEEWQWQMMEALRKLLDTDEKGKPYAASYAHTLDKVILEKSEQNRL